MPPSSGISIRFLIHRVKIKFVVVIRIVYRRIDVKLHRACFIGRSVVPVPQGFRHSEANPPRLRQSDFDLPAALMSAVKVLSVCCVAGSGFCDGWEGFEKFV